MTTATERLERRYRGLLRCYPSSWRRHRADEMVGVLLAQAEAEGRTTVGLPTAIDLVGHGLEARLDRLVRWVPTRLRHQIAMVALVGAAGLSAVMLVGEVVGAHYRPSDQDYIDHTQSFVSGPFLTVGVGMYVAYLTAASLVVLGRGGVARLLVVAAVLFAGRMSSLDGYPTPQPMVLVLFAGLGLLAALATVRPDPPATRGLVGHGAGFVAVVAVALLAGKPLLSWSVGTMATSGNVALAALAATLPLVVGVAMLTAAVRSTSRPGWSVALAVVAYPVVLFCTGVSQAVNPMQADARAVFPVLYVLVVAVVAAVAHQVQRRPATR